MKFKSLTAWKMLKAASVEAYKRSGPKRVGQQC